MDDDEETAQLIFETQETAAQRNRDVRTTEPYATDIAHYRPLDNDWPGVDDRGQLPNVKPWEENEDFNEYGLNAIPKSSSSQRGVIGYVNWYGDRAGERAVSKEKEFSWEYYRRESTEGLPIVVMLNGSRLYRSNRVEPFDAKIKMQWYTSRSVSRAYQDQSYSTDKVSSVKEIAPYRVKQDINLLDMTKIRTVVNLMRVAQFTGDKDVVESMQRIFYLSATDGTELVIDPEAEYSEKSVVLRLSNVPDDNVFCQFFDENYYKFDGWCFIKSTKPKIRELQRHHDEIYLLEPGECLERLKYAIREVNWKGAQAPRTIPEIDYERV